MYNKRYNKTILNKNQLETTLSIYVYTRKLLFKKIIRKHVSFTQKMLQLCCRLFD